MKTLLAYLALCTAAQAADVSVARIYWQPNDGGREVALYYEGGVRKGDIRRIWRALDEAKQDGKVVTTLWLDSWGGDGDTGMLLADLVARNRFDVFVDDECVSACAFAALVALGRGRLLITADADISVHQVTDDASGLPDVRWTRRAAERLVRYGAPRTPLEVMCAQPPSGMARLEPAWLAALGAQVMEQPFTLGWW
jgi:hypothetical protein